MSKSLEKICKNCTNWNVSTYPPKYDYHKCLAINRSSKLAQSGCGIYTTAKFSCILFEEMNSNE